MRKNFYTDKYKDQKPPLRTHYFINQGIMEFSIRKLKKELKQIEKEIKGKELLLHDVKNKSNAPFLNEVMEEISQLENEYFQYIEELDKLNKFKN